MVKRKKSTETQGAAGKIDVDKITQMDAKKIISIINKKHGEDVAYSLTEPLPSEVSEWIPTGSRVLDSIICKGRYAGIPVGRIAEVAGLESSGKSYLAAQIAANAQKMDMTVVYFESESSLDSIFLEQIGVDKEKFIFLQATNVEFVLETIEDILNTGATRVLFIWDSLAFTPSRKEQEADFNPQSNIAVKARVLAGGLSKLIMSFANTESTLLVLNQLKTNITTDYGKALTEPLVTPGGKSLNFAYSLRIWLTAKSSKASYVRDDKDFVVGTEVKALIKKSKFGTQQRSCNFKILWGGDEVSIMDYESWLDVVKMTPECRQGGAWLYIKKPDGSEYKMQNSTWKQTLQEDAEFRQYIESIMDNFLINGFADRSTDASHYYDQEVVAETAELSADE